MKRDEHGRFAGKTKKEEPIEIVKISREQAEEMAVIAYQKNVDASMKIWKEAGYIKLSPLEEAIEKLETLGKSVTAIECETNPFNERIFTKVSFRLDAPKLIDDVIDLLKGMKK